MSSTIEITIPTQLIDSFFFETGSVAIDHKRVKVWSEPDVFRLFPYELAFFQGLESYQPWLDAGKHIPVLLEKWKRIEGECGEFFAERKTKLTVEPMKEGISLFLTMLYWMHHQPVILQNWQQLVEPLAIKPVNVIERLTFIRQRPASYHAFIQLSELFLELEKQYATSNIKNRLRQ